MGSSWKMTVEDILLSLLALFVPPVAVGVRVGFWTKDTLINLLLCVLFYFFAMFHALYVIYTTSRKRTDYTPLDEEPDLEAQTTAEREIASEEEEEEEKAEESSSHEQPPNYSEITGTGIMTAAQAATDFKIQH